jgi:hypothetical protein
MDLGDTGPERLYLRTSLARAVDAIWSLDDRPLPSRLRVAYIDGLARLEPSHFPDAEGRALFESIVDDLNRYGEAMTGAGSMPTTLGTMSAENADELAKRIERLAALYGEA